MKLEKTTFILTCFFTNLLVYVVSTAVLALGVIFVASRTIAGLEADPLSGMAVAVGSVLLAMFIGTLSLIPSYFICMKLARYLRETRGWPIDRPRRLFAYSILAPVGLVALLILAAVFFQQN